LVSFIKVSIKRLVGINARADKFQKQNFPSKGLGGQSKAIVIHENSTDEQLNNIVAHYMPELKINLIPLFDLEKFIQIHKKMNKLKHKKSPFFFRVSALTDHEKHPRDL
jgi:hypothetical protein